MSPAFLKTLCFKRQRVKGSLWRLGSNVFFEHRSQVLRLALALFFVIGGVNHFVSPALYLSIMPPIFPAPLFLVYLSGVAEVAGGIGVLIPRWRRLAGWGLIALLIAVFPANIYALFHGMIIAGNPVPSWVLWVRLPFQLVFVAWVYAAALRRPILVTPPPGP